jgi:hypothetical protein
MGSSMVLSELPSGNAGRVVLIGQSHLEPVQHLGCNPSHSVRVQLYPLGEVASLLQTCNMLRRFQTQALK